MSRIAFTVETRPVGVNAAYRIVRKGKHLSLGLTTLGSAYKAHVQVAAGRATQGHPFEGRCSVEMRFFWPTAAGDVDGPVKLTLDAMQGGAYVNDRQLVRFTAERAKDAKHPRVEIVVTEIAPAEIAPADRRSVADRAKARDLFSRQQAVPSVRRFGS